MLIVELNGTEDVLVGAGVRIRTLEFRGGHRVAIGIEAPEHMRIRRVPALTPIGRGMRAADRHDSETETKQG